MLRRKFWIWLKGNVFTDDSLLWPHQLMQTHGALGLQMTQKKNKKEKKNNKQFLKLWSEYPFFQAMNHISWGSGSPRDDLLCYTYVITCCDEKRAIAHWCPEAKSGDLADYVHKFWRRQMAMQLVAGPYTKAVLSKAGKDF